MQKIIVTNRAQTIRENTTLPPEGFGGYLAQNIGTADVTVDGFMLNPGEKLDFSSIAENALWQTAITITVQPGGVVRIIRFMYSSGKEEPK